jgi:hypothetical protein
MEQAEKYCSISHTIANLDAEMIFNIEFKWTLPHLIEYSIWRRGFMGYAS